MKLRTFARQFTINFHNCLYSPTDGHILSSSDGNSLHTHIILSINKSVTFRSLHDDATEYTKNLVNWYHPKTQLRSVNDTLLTPKRKRTVKYGRR